MELSQEERMEQEDERIRETIFREKLLGFLRSSRKHYENRNNLF